MEASILKTYLRLNLLNLEGDDTRLEKLGTAASALSNGLASQPKNALPIFLGTLRPDDQVGEAFSEVSKAIEAVWPTYLGAFQGNTAVTVCRAVALQALVEAVEPQPVLGIAISLLMRNFGPLLQLGKNAEAIEILVKAADGAYDFERAPSPPTEEDETINVKASKFERTALQKRIEAAVGPSNRGGTALDNANQHWGNAGAAWSYDFSDRLTAILGDYLDSVLTKSAEMDSKNLSANMAQLQKAAKGDAVALNSTSLLWWRQALYSETAGAPYRNLEPVDAIVNAVLDLSDLIPPAYERALDSFLAEMMIYLQAEQKEIGATDILNVGSTTRDSLATVVDAPAGLMLGAISQKNIDPAIFKPSLPSHKWAIWLLREVMALRALDEPYSVGSNNA